MTVTLNYILEANLCLLLTLAFYLIFLQKETSFRLMRIYLLASIVVSLVFPLIDIENNQTASPLSISRVIPSYWLPEVVVGEEAINEVRDVPFNFWKYTMGAYSAGLVIFFLIILSQLLQVFRIMLNSKTYRLKKLRITESPDDKPTFSFFNFIFIGRAHELSAQEKEQIIRHESVHARQWHSFDILLIHVLKILFWFNPLISLYKKIFIQLHEFEADARTVENADMNKYCSLLARVALSSADLKIANHFNNSLTVKRIEMMRTIKTNVKKWKLGALTLVLPVIFFFVACQDQVDEHMIEIAKNSSHALIVPEEIREVFEKLKSENPNKHYVLVELNEKASTKLDQLQEQYGLPSSMQVYKTGDANNEVLGNISFEPRGSKMPVPRIEPTDGGQTFAILEFTKDVGRITEAASQDDKIFTVVEQQPEFSGGYNAMMDFIRNNLRYPTSARQQGIEGTVYASFVTEKDGAISSVNIVRGISPECDDEVKRVVKLFPKWKPGKQGGQPVRVRFVLPVKFGFQ